MTTLDQLNSKFDQLHKHYSRMMWMYGDVKRQRPCVKRVRQAIRANVEEGFKLY